MTILDTLRNWFKPKQSPIEIALLYKECGLELGPEPIKKIVKPRKPKVKEIKFTLK
jgi:hypothetical protein